MTGEIEIRSGGAVSVDTATLHHAASRFHAFEEHLAELRGRLGQVQGVLYEQRRYASDAYTGAAAAFQRLTTAIDGAEAIAAALRRAAAVYELVELDVRHRVAVTGGETATAERLDARRRELLAVHAGLSEEALGAELERTLLWPSEVIELLTEFGLEAGGIVSGPGGVVGGVALGGAGVLAAAVTGLTGSGLVPRGARLTGGAVPVVLRARAAPAAPAPATLAAAASRIPSGPSRVRVETYTMCDGSRQYAVYVAGTADWSTTGPQAFDMGSNLALARGVESASYSAVTQALEAAGARPGDPVHAFGHSQGATVASWLATSGEYDTRTLVTFGSPVSADVGAETLSVGIRHTDDVVTVLAGGGHLAPVGAPGSFIVETTGAPQSVVPELPGPAHPMAAYAETAAKVDASADPRVGALRDVFGELSSAASVTVTEYAATRAPAPVVAPGPSPARTAA